MSLSLYLTAVRPTTVFNGNITHNLNKMADEAGIYQHLWRPDELNITHAGDLIIPLTNALALMRADPERFKQHNPANGWGDYNGFVKFVEEYLTACQENPDAEIRASR